jgi:hypothetical protein
VTAGHVFVVAGDIRALASDAWLLPTDVTQHLSRWRPGWSRGFELPKPPAAPERWTDGLALPWPGWPADRSMPWRVNVAGSRGRPGWIAESTARWLDHVAAGLRDTPPRNGRGAHLVAMPVIGTGSGGHHHRAGDVLKDLLPTLRHKAAELGIDLALVARDPDVFAAAHALRASDDSWWPEVTDEERRGALGLAADAGRGELVLFLGAGASSGAGLPDWNGLLHDLAREAGIPSDLSDWKRLAFVDQAAIVQRRLGAAMNRSIALRFQRPEAGLLHHLLASLPVNEAITTNYDDLFELAAGKDRVSVLPHEPRPEAGRWLLKMHGCVTKPSDIVLTREDYLRYEERRAALAGIVQAMLLTRQMLFVGFSLNDDNFHKVADAVRRARDPDPERHPRARFGIVLKLFREPFVEELWKDELGFVAMGAELPADAADRTRTLAARARRLEIFLDYVLAHAPIDPAHFMAGRFGAMLTDGERTLRDELVALNQRLPPEARTGPAWDRIRDALRRLGCP